MRTGLGKSLSPGGTGGCVHYWGDGAVHFDIMLSFKEEVQYPEDHVRIHLEVLQFGAADVGRHAVEGRGEIQKEDPDICPQSL